MIFLLTILVISFIFIGGYSVINLFNFSNKSFLEKIAYSWGLGVGLIGIQIFFYSIFSIEWSRATFLTPWIILIIISFWKYKPKLDFKIGKFDRAEKIFLSLIGLLLGFTAIESVIRPVQAWDAWSSWLLKPKVYFLNNNLSPDYVHYVNDEYPLIIPLMSTFYYKIIGSVNDVEVLLFFYIFYFVIAILFYAKTKEIIGKKMALIFTFLLISTQNLIRHGGRFEAGQADLPLAFFILASACLLLDYLKSKDLKYLFLLNLFLGFSALVKNDGIPIFLIGNLITLFFVIKSKKLANLVVFIPSTILFGSWNIYKYVNDYPKNFIAGSGAFHSNEIFSITEVMIREFFNIQNWNLLWIVFLVSAVIYYKDVKKIWPVFLLIAVQWIFYFFAFILSPFPRGMDHAVGIIDRLYIHIAPLALLISVLLISLNIRNEKEANKK